MTYLAQLKIGGTPVLAPSGVPTGGLTMAAQILKNSIVIIMIAAIILVLFMLVFSGIQWMTSGGDKAALDNVKKRLTFTIIGLVIIFLAFFVINVIGIFFNVPLLTIPSS